MDDSQEDVTFKDRLIGWGLQPILWLLMFIFKVHRIEAVDKVPLEAPIEEAFLLYGEPYESEPDNRRPEATVHKFDLGPFHDVYVSEWQGLVHGVSFWSARGSPTHDLRNVMKAYGHGVEWVVLETGYSFLRKDRRYRIFCSAMPAIGVVTVAFTTFGDDDSNTQDTTNHDAAKA